MMSKMRLAAFGCLIGMAAQAGVKLGAPFTDGVVLQRDRAVPVWGTADAGANVTLSFAGQERSAMAGPDGRWRVDLPPMKASKEPRDLVAVVGGQADDRVVVRDVLVGEVWLAAGQSNMYFPLWGEDPRFRDAWGAVVRQTTNKPFVRLAKVAECASETPNGGLSVRWCRMTPDCEDRTSAVAYYYALELANALDVPVAVVCSAVCASRIEPWIPRSGFASVAGLERERDWTFVPKDEWRTRRPANSPIIHYSHQPSMYWNGMVAALAPMAVRGMIWYQGCSNSHDYQDYCKMMHALYNGWSREFRNPALSLYFVQVAPWGDPVIPHIQEAQAQFASEEPHAAMAVINDVGNLKDIHPNDKRTVAKRLALQALRRDYGFTNVKSESPTLRSWRIEGNRFVLTFDDAERLFAYDPDWSLKTGFEVAGADGQWKPARIGNFSPRPGSSAAHPSNGDVRDDFLVVVSDEVQRPAKLRYLHSAPWFGALCNEVGLPLGAFHIDGEPAANDDYEVEIDGRPVAVRAARESRIPFNRLWPGHQRPLDQTELAACVSLESAGPVAVTVTVKDDFEKAVVRPLSAGVKPSVSGRKVSLTLPKPGHYVLETHGASRVLYLFVNPPCDFAAERKAATRTFGPGVHEVGILDLKDHDRIYIDREAVVYGCLRGVGVTDVRISGYGVIDGSRIARVTGEGYGPNSPSCLRLTRCRDVVVDGPVLQDSPEWTFAMFDCEDVTVSNVKIVGQWRYNTDGIDVCNSRRVRVTDSFVRTFDDGLVVKGVPPYADSPVEDVSFERCVVWCGWGKTIEPGFETWAPVMRSIRFVDCDLIHNSLSAINISAGGPALVDGMTFENIRVELQNDTLPEIYQSSDDMKYDSKGKRGEPMLIKADNRLWTYYYDVLDKTAKRRHAHLKNIAFRRIAVFADPDVPPPVVAVQSFGSDGVPPRPLENVVLENFSLNGRPADWSAFSIITNTPAVFK